MVDWIGTYARVRLPQAIIILCPFDNYESACRAGRLFAINENASEDDQTLQMLHEIYHGHPDFRGQSAGLNRDAHIEAMIEERAQETMRTRPDIVVLVKKALATERARVA